MAPKPDFKLDFECSFSRGKNQTKRPKHAVKSIKKVPKKKTIIFFIFLVAVLL